MSDIRVYHALIQSAPISGQQGTYGMVLHIDYLEEKAKWEEENKKLKDIAIEQQKRAEEAEAANNFLKSTEAWKRIEALDASVNQKTLQIAQMSIERKSLETQIDTLQKQLTELQTAYDNGFMLAHAQAMDKIALREENAALRQSMEKYRASHLFHGVHCDSKRITWNDRMYVSDSRCDLCKETDELFAARAAQPKEEKMIPLPHEPRFTDTATGNPLTDGNTRPAPPHPREDGAESKPPAQEENVPQVDEALVEMVCARIDPLTPSSIRSPSLASAVRYGLAAVRPAIEAAERERVLAELEFLRDAGSLLLPIWRGSKTDFMRDLIDALRARLAGKEQS